MSTSLTWWVVSRSLGGVTVMLGVEGPRLTVGLGRTCPQTSVWPLHVSGVPCRELPKIPVDGPSPPGLSTVGQIQSPGQ